VRKKVLSDLHWLKLRVRKAFGCHTNETRSRLREPENIVERCMLGARSVSAGVVAVALFLVGCGGPAKPAAAPEADPWADYKGTFAGPVGAKESAAPAAKAAKAPAASKDAVGTTTTTSAALTSPDASDAAPAKAKHKPRSGTGASKAKSKGKPKKAGAPES
jgi:hypothetical protein